MLRGLSQALKTGGGAGDIGLSTVTGLFRFVELALEALLLDAVFVIPATASDSALLTDFPVTPAALFCTLA